jgi:hypothetical protein
MARARRSALVLSVASLLCLLTALNGATAVASPAGGIKGDPQPELKPFKIGASNYAGGSVAIEPDGGLVVAYGSSKGKGKVVVCLLDRAKSKCSSQTTLSPLGSDSLYGVPEVFVPSVNHVVILAETCCDSSSAGGDLLWSSTDGGRAFGAPVRVGTLGVDAAALIGGSIVFSQSLDTNGAEVESIPTNASGPPGSTAIATSKKATDIAVGGYQGGALVASDDLGADYTTYVEYAPSGDDFNASSSYQRVGSFSHEQLVAMSSAALLTVQTKGSQNLELRLFNGSSYGAAHAVPGTKGRGPEWFTVDQDASGRVYVFSERARSGRLYHLYERSTTNGTRWSAPVDLGDAVQSNSFGAALDSMGSGLVVGTDNGAAAWGYPVLGTQSVSFSLKSSTIKKGRSTTGSGKGSPPGTGREVELQVERSGLWYTVATTHEGAGGSFSFTIKGTSAGKYVYRAVVSDLAGYLRYGYSAGRTLRVTT